ncbi:MAG: tRNA (adenosine(37)-N6)-threonylcarbamoyltransferase complex transferase subunit TsaD [Candidatus Portnoybacteria bacterium CG10_big_fil_rev_8_21_14_0_10_44_7]|uniref:tRNA N6-adenosine threonylcarbamoyltransferase n=1 Tax=Candidatus Portnoybacteria bacterium CG10_big_fil_rev_8_21_14_0_10_44_7 TaxID=1974816 RepID=A0A2M8KIM1_9BACT|nr:MAG: tRNA (adenosine(37)-N6)-threonylcarbamoyltransferase complex transferase subunit TsaD [Candidatus Portnoybacteria bacterium CG10_big_fil_rev_8_21_14_0_10_44_7]
MENKAQKTILAVETSCDDTGVAVLSFDAQNNVKIPLNFVSSQIKIHAPFGGVVPNLAAREHQKNLPFLLQKTLSQIGRFPDLLAVTIGPGLIPALLVGVAAAQALSFACQKPVLPVNHLAGHLAAAFLPAKNPLSKLKASLPILALIVSGGHTELIFLTTWTKNKIIGQTLDDAAGEAFDKVAKLLGLPYPGGPAVARLARQGRANTFALPRPMLAQKNYNFSFSGLKTAVYYLVKKQVITLRTKADLCASFQAAVLDVLTSKTERAIENLNPKTLLLSGGVAANQALRRKIGDLAKKHRLSFLAPDIRDCTDNAAMIALAGFFGWRHNQKPVRWPSLRADAHQQI